MLTRSLVLTLSSFFVVPAVAQVTRQVTAPPGYATSNASYLTWRLGAYANGRFQMGDGTLRGSTFRIVRLANRVDLGRTYNNSNGMGRTWSRLTLSMAETDVPSMTTSWVNNRKTAMTQVFSGANVSWPRLTGRATTAAWGRPMDLPFAQPWLYSGKDDLLFEYDFTGGRLSNGARWGGYRAYHLDGTPEDVSVSGSSRSVPAVVGTCNDSAITVTNGAYASGSVTLFGDQLLPEWQKDKITIQHWSWYTAPQAPVIQVLTQGSPTAGVNIGAACHRFYLDLSRAVALTTRVTDNRGYSGIEDGNGRYLLPYLASWLGAGLTVQAAWEDSGTRRFSLTAARHFFIPAAKPKPLRRQMVYGPNPNPFTANAVSSARGNQTLVRLTVQ